LSESRSEPSTRESTTGPAGDDTPTGSITIVPTRVTSTANTPEPGVGRHAASDDAPGADPADDRGRLELADVVVEKVAMVAADEVEHVGGPARRVLGVPTGGDAASRRPQVSATVTGQVAALDVRLSVAYPAAVRATTEAVRDHLRERVQTLTGLTVSRVDIAVTALTTTSSSAAATGRVVA